MLFLLIQYLNIINNEIFPDSYDVYRKDRNRHGGGLFIMIKDRLPTSEITSESSLEIVWAKVHTRNSIDLIRYWILLLPTKLSTSSL